MKLPLPIHLAKTALWSGVLKRPAPLILLVEPTSRCNARCSFCYHWKERGDEELSIDRWESVLAEGFRAGSRFLYVSGGEPTLYPHLERLLRSALALGYRTTITTNGIRLAQRANLLKRTVSGVTVSLDAIGPAHDELRSTPGLYEKAVEGLIAVRERGIPGRINMTLSRLNKDAVEPLIQLAQVLDVQLHVRLMTQEGPGVDAPTLSWEEAREMAARLLALKKSHPGILVTPSEYLVRIRDRRGFRCRLLSLLVTVDSRGRMYVPCPVREEAKQAIAGNVALRDLNSVYHSPEADDLRREGLACTPTLDCYTSCLLDISLLADLSPRMLLSQLLEPRSLTQFFGG